MPLTSDLWKGIVQKVRTAPLADGRRAEPPECILVQTIVKVQVQRSRSVVQQQQQSNGPIAGRRALDLPTLVMTGEQNSWVQPEGAGHWLARVQRPSHQPHSVTLDDSRQEVQLVS